MDPLQFSAGDLFYFLTVSDKHAEDLRLTADQLAMLHDYLPLVKKHAHRYAVWSGLRFDDVHSVSLLAAARACGKYHPGRGTTPRTWIILCMRQAAMRAYALRHNNFCPLYRPPGVKFTRRWGPPVFLRLAVSTETDPNADLVLANVVDRNAIEEEAARDQEDYAVSLCRVILHDDARDTRLMVRYLTTDVGLPTLADELGISKQRVEQLVRKALLRWRAALGVRLAGRNRRVGKPQRTILKRTKARKRNANQAGEVAAQDLGRQGGVQDEHVDRLPVPPAGPVPHAV